MRRIFMLITVPILTIILFVPVLLATVLYPAHWWRVRVAHYYSRALSRYVLAVCGVTFEVDDPGGYLGMHPAVYCYNHCSNIDFFVLSLVAPLGVLVFAKRLLVAIPCVGWTWFMSGHPMIDRRNRANWQKRMDQVVASMRSGGYSVLIAPEGTRSLNGTLGPFKKGPFHVALDTGAPMLPIVLHGVPALISTLGPKPGHIKVQVLPPIPSTDWERDRLEDHIATVRQEYLIALGQAVPVEASA